MLGEIAGGDPGERSSRWNRGGRLVLRVAGPEVGGASFEMSLRRRYPWVREDAPIQSRRRSVLRIAFITRHNEVASTSEGSVAAKGGLGIFSKPKPIRAPFSKKSLGTKYSHAAYEERAFINTPDLLPAPIQRQRGVPDLHGAAR